MKEPYKGNASNNDLNSHVGKRVRQLRHILNLNQSNLASKISVTYQQLQKYESGTSNLSVNMLEKIGRALNEEIINLVGNGSDREDLLDILKLIINNSEYNTSSKNLRHLNTICGFLAKPEAHDVTKALTKLLSALEQSDVLAEPR